MENLLKRIMENGSNHWGNGLWDEIVQNNLHHNSEFMRQAFNGDPYLLKFAVDGLGVSYPKTINITKEIFADAVINEPWIGGYLCGLADRHYDYIRAYITDKEFVLDIISQNKKFYDYLNNELKNDPDIIRATKNKH